MSWKLATRLFWAFVLVWAVVWTSVGMTVGADADRLARCPTEDSCRPAYVHGQGWVGVPVTP